MFTSKRLNKKINRIQKSLRLVLNDNQSTLDEMFDTLNEKTIHQQCIDHLLSEVYKFLIGYSPDIMDDVFHLRQNTYNLQNFHGFATDAPRNVYTSILFRSILLAFFSCSRCYCIFSTINKEILLLLYLDNCKPNL